jgi:hypothetical protein
MEVSDSSKSWLQGYTAEPDQDIYRHRRKPFHRRNRTPLRDPASNGAKFGDAIQAEGQGILQIQHQPKLGLSERCSFLRWLGIGNLPALLNKILQIGFKLDLGSQR